MLHIILIRSFIIVKHMEFTIKFYTHYYLYLFLSFSIYTIFFIDLIFEIFNCFQYSFSFPISIKNRYF